jgi:hypothetical protein
VWRKSRFLELSIGRRQHAGVSPRKTQTYFGSITAETQLKAKIIDGDDLYNTTGVIVVTDKVATVKELLGPLAQANMPILRYIGLNYIKHSISLPEY